MTTPSTRRRQILKSLEDFEYRHALVEEHVAVSLPFQLRAMREERGWTQEELGQRCGKAQEWICKLENPNYGRFSTQTLKTLARAFDVALEIRFRRFSYFVDGMMLNRRAGDLRCAPYSEDTALMDVELAKTADDTNTDRLAVLFGATSGKKAMLKAHLTSESASPAMAYN